jgi:DNA repair exonuclease SbcCD ATPase subunit
MNAAAERQEIDNNIKVADRKTEAARVEYTNANQLKEDAEGTRDMFQNRYDERLAAGEDPESFRMRNLQKIIGQQNDRVSAASDALTAAQQKYDAAKDLTAELNTQKSNLG